MKILRGCKIISRRVLLNESQLDFGAVAHPRPATMHYFMRFRKDIELPAAKPHCCIDATSVSVARTG